MLTYRGFIEVGIPSMSLFVEAKLDHEVNVDDAVLVDQVISVPRPGVDLTAPTQEAVQSFNHRWRWGRTSS